MVSYKTKISSYYHVVIYFALFHNKPASGLPPGTRVEWAGQQLSIVHENFNIAKNAARELDKKVLPLYLHIHHERPLDGVQLQAIKQLS